MTDLAWLNDMELAKLLCQSPVPIFTGIGHERDNTILDEIAHTRFDTPSKVALHISTTIKDNALAAIQAWERINALVGRIVLRERTMLATQADRIETGVRTVLRRVESDQEGFLKLIQTTMTAQVREATIALETEQDEADRWSREGDVRCRTRCCSPLGVHHSEDSDSTGVREVRDRTSGPHSDAQSPDPARCGGA